MLELLPDRRKYVDVKDWSPLIRLFFVLKRFEVDYFRYLDHWLGESYAYSAHLGGSFNIRDWIWLVELRRIHLVTYFHGCVVLLC